MRFIAVLVAAFAVVSAAPVWAVCLLPGKAPDVVSGATASQAEMKTSHDVIQAYVKQLEAYQTCVDHEITTAPPNTPVETKAGWRAQSDAAIDAAQSIAASYSDQFKMFKTRGK